MPLFFIQFRNSKYCARDDGAEHDSAEAALATGVHGAMQLATEEIAGGSCNAAVEISIEGNDGTRLLNSVVAVSVSPLIIGAMPHFGDGVPDDL